MSKEVTEIEQRPEEKQALAPTYPAPLVQRATCKTSLVRGSRWMDGGTDPGTSAVVNGEATFRLGV